MKEERYHIALDDYEHGVVIRALNDTKTELMNERIFGGTLPVFTHFDGDPSRQHRLRRIASLGFVRIHGFDVQHELRSFH